MKRCLSILAFGLLLLTSCLNELQGDREEATGPSNIVLNIATKPQTKLGAASDGDVMSNLHIWLVYGTKVEGYLCQTHDDCTISDSGSTATATFENVPRGACTLYLVANLPVDSSLPDAFGVGSTITDDFLKYVLPEVVNHEPPYGASTPGMPLSTSVSLSVGAGTNKVSAELVRTCAKLTITVRNNTTNNTIILKDLILSKRNPNIGYLFEQSDYSIPLAADFGEFRPYAHSAGETVTDTIPQGGERIFVQQYMYETATDGAANLGFQIVGGLFPNGTDRAKVVNVVTGGGGTKTEYYFDPSNKPTSQSAIPTGTPCLIKSRDNDYYLCDNNGTLKAGSLNPGNQIVDSTYLWVFSSSNSPTTIKNLKTNKYISITGDKSGNGSFGMSNTAVSLQINSSSPSFGFYVGNTNGQTNWKKESYSYNLSISSNSIKVITNTTYGSNSTVTPSSSPACLFQIYKPEPLDTHLPETTEDRLFREDGTTPADVYFDKKVTSLNYINKYGIPVPLEQIRRNQDVKIVVNIHYNPNSGVLFFETSDWVDDKNETTFD
ncbi:MAG: RICIN domain-containing protein [Candidatus Cryptobacteroides sp.]